MESISVVVAEDHEIVRKGIVALLEQEPDVKVVGEAKDGQEAVDLVEDCQPDVVVMDLSMPNLNGIEATRRIKKSVPATEVLALSIYDDEQYVHRVFDAGASGYLVKDTAVSVLVTAIKEVSRGNGYLSPTISKRVLDMFKSPKRRGESNKAEVLSTRENEVLQLIAEGYTNKEIAEILCRAPKTIGNHRSNIMRKLEIHDVAGLTRYAIKHGIVSEDGRIRKRF